MPSRPRAHGFAPVTVREALPRFHGRPGEGFQGLHRGIISPIDCRTVRKGTDASGMTLHVTDAE